MHPNLSFDEERIKEFCRKNHILKLSFFGSVLNEKFGPDSDVDVLVEFEQGHTPGFKFFALQEQLADIFGRKVDLHTPHFLSSYFRDQVMAEAQVQYAA